MTEVIMKYIPYFQALQVFNSKPLPSRSVICTPFFQGVLRSVTDSKVRAHLLSYQLREETRFHPPPSSSGRK